MDRSVNRKLIGVTVLVIIFAWLIWTILFFNNPVFRPVIWDIHLIYTGTLLAYTIVKFSFRDTWVDLFKIFIRTMFRVWLIIFITLVVNRSMDKVGLVLSVTFMFGYFEGLVDIDRWLLANNGSAVLAVFKVDNSRYNHTAGTLLFMSLIHILCALIIRLFYLIN